MADNTAPVVRFSLPAAQDALARSDDGDDALPGDSALIDAYELYLQQEQDRYEYARYEAERRQRIAEAKADHADDCDGGGCDHWTHDEQEA